MTNNILVTNVGGFRRLDIRNLVKNVKNYSNATVVTSDSPKNAAGPNLTFCGFLTINEYTFDNIRFYAVGRLPTDRVKIVERKPNIILPSEYHNLIGHISVYVLSYEEILLSYLNVKYISLLKLLGATDILSRFTYLYMYCSVFNTPPQNIFYIIW